MKSKLLISSLAITIAFASATACSSKTTEPKAQEQTEAQKATETAPAATQNTETTQAETARTVAPENAKVFITEPAQGATVPATFTVKFGLENMTVAPAGTQDASTGHHHLLIDTETLPALDQPLPATEKIIHFGKGQTETSITLAPGQHTLQLILGDGNHIPHQPPVTSEKITVTVQ